MGEGRDSVQVFVFSSMRLLTHSGAAAGHGKGDRPGG